MTKRILLFLASSIYLLILCVLSKAREVVTKSKPCRKVVIYYHGIPHSSREAFEKQLEVLQRVAKVIDIDQLERHCSAGLSVAITFDDAFVSVFENAIPLLKSFAFPATIFVPTLFMGGPANWIADEKHRLRHERVISAADLSLASTSDLLTIGSHCVSHRKLSTLPLAQIQQELADSRRTLETIVRKPIRHLAFPHGEYDKTVVSCVKGAGYSEAFCIEPWLVGEQPEDIVLGRISVEPTDTLMEFFVKISGGYSWLPHLKGFLKRARSTP